MSWILFNKAWHKIDCAASIQMLVRVLKFRVLILNSRLCYLSDKQ